MKKGNNWFVFAEEDIKMAELAFKEKIYNQVCFHSQQGVEKILKGYLESKNKLSPKTHKLTDIASLIKNTELKNLKNEIILLDRFYIPTRYPDAIPGSLPEGLPTEKDAIEALRIAKKVMKLIKNLVKRKGDT